MRRFLVVLASGMLVSGVLTPSFATPPVEAHTLTPARPSLVPAASGAKKFCVTKKSHGAKKKYCTTPPGIDWSPVVASWAHFADTQTLDVRVESGAPPPATNMVRHARAAATTPTVALTDVILSSTTTSLFANAVVQDATGAGLITTASGIDVQGNFSFPPDLGILVPNSTATSPIISLQLMARETFKFKGKTFTAQVTSAVEKVVHATLQGHVYWDANAPGTEIFSLAAAESTGPAPSVIIPGALAVNAATLTATLTPLAGLNCDHPAVTQAPNATRFVQGCNAGATAAAFEFGLGGAAQPAVGETFGFSTFSKSGNLNGMAILETTSNFISLLGPRYWTRMIFTGRSTNDLCDLTGVNFTYAVRVDLTPSTVSFTMPDGSVFAGSLTSSGNGGFQATGTSLGDQVTFTGTLDAVNGGGSFVWDEPVSGAGCDLTYQVAFTHLAAGRLDSLLGAVVDSATLSRSRTVPTTVINNSGVPVTFQGASIDGNYWSVTSAPGQQNAPTCIGGLVLQSGQSCVLFLAFAPTGSAGEHDATLHVRSDAADDPDLTISLIGFAHAPVCASFSGLSGIFTAHNGQLPLSFKVSGKISGDPSTDPWDITISGLSFTPSPPLLEQANFSLHNPYEVSALNFNPGELDVYLTYNARAKTMTLSATASAGAGSVVIDPATVSVTSVPGFCP